MEQSRVESTGKSILEHGKPSGALGLHKWASALMDRMMGNENFRVAALRFTDVAPTLRTDNEFMDHLSSYFSEVGGLKHFIGEGIPGSGLLGKVVAPLVRRNIKGMAHSFIAGETLEDGLETFRKLHDDNIACAMDLLGEAVISKAEAETFMAAYHASIEKTAEAAKSWPAPHYPERDRIGPICRANVSIKLSALYEHVDPAAHAETVAALSERFAALLRTAVKHGTYIHVDVEQYHLLPITLDVFEQTLMQEEFRTYPHVGIVCQAYLRNGEELLDHLIHFAKKRGTPFSIRLVKGAYWDYEQAMAEQLDWPCPVFDKKEHTDANFEHLTVKLLKAFPLVRPCIGSHNARSLAVAIETMKDCGLDKADVEFQVLHGMAESFRNALRNMGFRVRQYCPVGEFIPGMSYLVRRLLENTANQSFLRMHTRREADVDGLLKAPAFDGALLTTPKAQEPSAEESFLNQPLLDFSLAHNRERAATALEKIKPQLPVTVTPVINGSPSPSKGGLVHHCPWDVQTQVSDIRLASTKEADAAVTAAKAAFPAWRDTPAEERAAILERAAEAALAHWDELFALQVYEAGKDWVHTDADIAEGIDFMRYYARQIRTLDHRFQPMNRWGEANHTVYEPRGVAAVVAPWNFPFAISAGMTSAALAAGNTVVYKPAEQTSATGQLLARIYKEAGVPDGAFHFLPGKGEDVGAKLVAHPEVALIAFTGSREVGLHILREAAQVPPGQKHVKKCVIEMGGKNAIIVDSDADLDEAVPGVVNSAFGFQGQKCSACSRVIIVGSAYKPFVERLKDMVESLRVGPAKSPVYDVNAVIDDEAFKKINGYLKIGKKDGKLLAAAKAPDGGHFIAPHVFTDLKKGSKLTEEEVFGPVLAVYKAASVEEAVAMALESDYALTGGLFSRNPKSIAYTKQNFRVGNLYINRGITGALVGRQPFGGGALSGTGTKAGGPDYLLHFTEPRVMTENTMRRGYAPKQP